MSPTLRARLAVCAQAAAQRTAVGQQGLREAEAASAKQAKEEDKKRRQHDIARLRRLRHAEEDRRRL